MTDRHDDTTPGGPVDAPQVPTAILRGFPGASFVPDTAQLLDALRQLSTLLLLTAEAADNIVAALTGEPPDSDPYAEPARTDSWPVRAGHRTDSGPYGADTTPDMRPANERPRLSVVRPLTPDNGTEAS